MTQEAASEELLRELEDKPTKTTQELREKRSLAEEYDSITATVVTGDLIYRPYIIEHSDSGPEESTPALNWISHQLTEQKYEKPDETDADDKDMVEVNPMKLERLLMEYYLSDDFLEAYTDSPHHYEIERYMTPVIALLLEPKGDFADHYDGEHLLAYIAFPFHRDNAKTIITALENNEEVTITERNDRVADIQFLNNKTTAATLHSHPEKRFPFEVPALKQRQSKENSRAGLIWDHLVESEYEDWLKIPTTKPLTKNDGGQYELHLEQFDKPFCLEDPLTWNEDHPAIQLIENYGGGDPEQMDYVYARPSHPLLDTPDHVIEHQNENVPWEIATQFPQKEDEQHSHSYLDFLQASIFLLMTLLFMWLTAALIVPLL